MMSWLRRLFSRFFAKAQPEPETTGHAHDVQAAPALPEIMAFRAPDVSPAAAREHSTSAADTAPELANAPAAQPALASPAIIGSTEQEHAETRSALSDCSKSPPADTPVSAAPGAALRDAFALPHYDPELCQNLANARWALGQSPEYIAQQRAKMIAALLAFTSTCKAEAALQWLTIFFRDKQLASTFEAIHDVAQESLDSDQLDFETLQAMSALKDLWSDNRAWWVRRVVNRRANPGGTSIVEMRRGDLALSWRVARAICVARGDYQVDEMIDPDWMDEWRALDPDDDGAASFVDFLRRKIERMRDDALHEGLTQKAREWEAPWEASQHFASRNPRYWVSDGDMVGLEVVDVTSPRRRKVEDEL